MVGASTARWLALAGAALLLGAGTPPRATVSPIADAAMSGDTASVRALIKNGADVNAPQGDGMTALHWAAQRGDVAEAQMLVYAGARLEATTRNASYTPLHLAARAGKAEMVKALLDAGAAFDARTSAGGVTPLHFAAGEGTPASIVALLDKGAQINVRDTATGETPLMWAAANNRLEAVRTLTKRGADVGLMSNVRDPILLDSLEKMQVQLHKRRLAALKAAENPIGSRPAAKDSPTTAKDSAAAKRDSTQRADADSTFAHPEERKRVRPPVADTAVNSDSVRRAQSNINRGPSFSELVGNTGGLTALDFAIRQGNTDCVVALLDAGADINQVTGGDHSSPLLMAAINGQFDIAKLLLDRGANPKLASDAGTTPLYAVINVQWSPKTPYPQPVAQANQKISHLELMQALIDKGADVNARLKKHLWFMSYNFDLLGVNTAGANPFWRAAYGLDVPAMKLLVAHGADYSVATIKPEGRLPGADPNAPDSTKGKADPSGLPPVPKGGPGVFPIHAATGVGYGEGFAANIHAHAPDAWMAAVKYLVEELHADVNQRDFNGYTPLHHAASRGDNEMIQYLVSKGADITAVSRKGETVADMANGPVQRIPPFLETVKLAEQLGSKNSHKCKSC
jgi:ankyrin repeat protein